MKPFPNIEPGWYSEAQFTHPTDECPHPEHWHTYDIQATEAEVIEMVSGMIRGLQPEVVLETGTSRGYMAASIANALHQNGHGMLYTYEPDDTLESTTIGLLGRRPEVFDHVTLCREFSMLNPWPRERGYIDFCWFDSAIEERIAELKFYEPYMSPRCVIGFHDTAAKFGDWIQPIWDMEEAGLIRVLPLPTPRGVLLCRWNHLVAEATP